MSILTTNSTISLVASFEAELNKPCATGKVWCVGLPCNVRKIRIRSQRLMDPMSNATSSLLDSEKPLFTFGVITDVQYADIPDGKSFLGVPRYYRHSMEVLQRAVSTWKTKKEESMLFAMHFGDLVDGFCPKELSREAVLKTVTEFDAFGGPVYHMLGNHCLYNLPRSELNKILQISSSESFSFYSFTPLVGFRFVVLDGYDVSAIGWPEDHPHYKQAIDTLERKNPNANKNSPDGLHGLERRFVMFNGGVGNAQLVWLDGVLQDATLNKEKVIVCCHLPLYPGVASPATLLWNFEEVLEVIHRYKCVKACFSGHAHDGGYAVDSHGIHHRVLEAVLECPPGTDAYGYVNVFENRLSLVGFDRMESSEMVFN